MVRRVLRRATCPAVVVSRSEARGEAPKKCSTFLGGFSYKIIITLTPPNVTPEFSSDLERVPGARSIADENSGVTPESWVRYGARGATPCASAVRPKPRFSRAPLLRSINVWELRGNWGESTDLTLFPSGSSIRSRFTSNQKELSTCEVAEGV